MSLPIEREVVLTTSSRPPSEWIGTVFRGSYARPLRAPLLLSNLKLSSAPPDPVVVNQARGEVVIPLSINRDFSKIVDCAPLHISKGTLRRKWVLTDRLLTDPSVLRANAATCTQLDRHSWVVSAAVLVEGQRVDGTWDLGSKANPQARDGDLRELGRQAQTKHTELQLENATAWCGRVFAAVLASNSQDGKTMDELRAKLTELEKLAKDHKALADEHAARHECVLRHVNDTSIADLATLRAKCSNCTAQR